MQTLFDKRNGSNPTYAKTNMKKLFDSLADFFCNCQKPEKLVNQANLSYDQLDICGSSDPIFASDEKMQFLLYLWYVGFTFKRGKL